MDRASSDLADIRKKISKQIRLTNKLAEDLIRDPSITYVTGANSCRTYGSTGFAMENRF